MNENMTGYDVVIVGGGAAGLSAALVLSRARRTVAVIDAGAPRNAPAARMHGFLSRDGESPASLLTTGRQEVARYGGHLIEGAVADARQAGEGRFEVRLTEGRRLTARRVLVATGLRDELPDIPGLRERWGVDLLHCPYCHGYEVAGQPLGVLGGTPDAILHAHLIRQWSDDVVYFPHTDTLPADQRERLAVRSVAVVEGAVRRLVVEEDRLQGVELEDGTVVPRSAVFVRPRMVPHDQLPAALGCRLDERGWVVVDATGRTSVPGVWAAGNVANPRAQVITAAGEGSAAAIALNGDLTEEDVALALRHRRAP